MKIKHSKFRNTGLIYELLVRQIASDTLVDKESAAIKILKKYFSNNSLLNKELRLYEIIQKSKSITPAKAETVISTITEISRRFNLKELKKLKYELISELRKSYNLDEFFSIKINEYKPFAALYCLMEAQNNAELVDPQVLIDNKITLLEFMTSKKQDAKLVKNSLIEEYSKYDKDLKLLTYKILLEKFNKKYSNLLPEQKTILREFIVSVSSTTKLRNFVNEKLVEVKEKLDVLIPSIKNEIIKIKIQEISKNIQPLSNKEVVDDSTLALLMEYYELLKEVKNL